MKYNFIKTDNVIESIFDINSTTLDELNKEYDFTILDEVVSSFKNILDQNKDKKFLIVGDYDYAKYCYYKGGYGTQKLWRYITCL